MAPLQVNVDALRGELGCQSQKNSGENGKLDRVVVGGGGDNI